MELITLISAVIAAITGIFTLLWTLVDRKDRIYVRCDSVRPMATPTKDLYVVNISKHKVKIRDYGFILDNGLLYSIPLMADLDQHFCDECSYDFVNGSTSLEAREIYSVGIELKQRVIGAYAVTTTQNFYRAGMKTTRWHPVTLWRYLCATLRPRYY